jgi:molecular chaperone DnaK
MSTVHAVGIDLGTTYSSIAYLNPQGEPVSIPNADGEPTTPSVVLFEPSGQAVVGVEALRNAIVAPERVVQHAKRWIGDAEKKWTIDGRDFTPVDVSALIIRQLLADAESRIGKVTRAVVTVPAQFSDLQRRDTVRAGQMAGLEQVEIINEPVAAALCYVLGSEGLWFTELAEDQRILVYDLGGGTFDLSLVSYRQNEVRVIATSGDLHLGGIDWNAALLEAISKQFAREFGADPRQDPISYQQLALEVEQCKRGLTARPKAALMVQHAGKRKTYQVEQEQFGRLTQTLVDRTEAITRKLLADNKMGWAHVDVVLSTGGSSRMPMIRETLKRMSGRTLNTSLSPDLSIAHGATYYAGMLLTNRDFARSILNTEATQRLSKIRQQSVAARGLGILVRDVPTNTRVPFYLMPPNTPLPASREHVFGTVIPNQRKVRLSIVESGISADAPHVEIGECVIDGLPPDLPVDSEIGVTISYDASARIQVSAVDKASGKAVTTELVRTESVRISHLAAEEDEAAPVDLEPTLKDRPAALSPSPTASRAPVLEDEEPIVLMPTTGGTTGQRPLQGRGDLVVPGVAARTNFVIPPPGDDSDELPVLLGDDESSEVPLPLGGVASDRTGSMPSILIEPPALPVPPKGQAAKNVPPPVPSGPPPLPASIASPPVPPKRPSVKPLPPPAALTPPAPAPPAPTSKKPTARAGTSSPALPSFVEDEILELPLASKKAGAPAPGAKPKAKAIPKPPAPGGSGGAPGKKAGAAGDDGEDEFFRLAGK